MLRASGLAPGFLFTNVKRRNGMPVAASAVLFPLQGTCYAASTAVL
jgi:hypothetical protein